MTRKTRAALAAAGALVTAATLAACGGGEPSALDTASDAQVAYYNAYSDSSAPEAFGGTYDQAITLGEAACSDLDDGKTVANLLGSADPADLEATKDVLAAAVTNLCPAYSGQVELLTERN